MNIRAFLKRMSLRHGVLFSVVEAKYNYGRVFGNISIELAINEYFFRALSSINYSAPYDEFEIINEEKQRAYKKYLHKDYIIPKEEKEMQTQPVIQPKPMIEQNDYNPIASPKVGVKKSWPLLEFARLHGKMKVAPFVNRETGETFKSCAFVDNKNNITLVAFSSKLGELTPKEIAQQKNELQIVMLESGTYKLCKLCEDTMENLNLANKQNVHDSTASLKGGVKKSWSLLEFARLHGKMKVAPFTDKETGENFKMCVFVNDNNDFVLVAFSNKLGELTPQEIVAQKEELQVVLLNSGNYKLCKLGNIDWEVVELEKEEMQPQSIIQPKSTNEPKLSKKYKVFIEELKRLCFPYLDYYIINDSDKAFGLIFKGTKGQVTYTVRESGSRIWVMGRTPLPLPIYEGDWHYDTQLDDEGYYNYGARFDDKFQKTMVEAIQYSILNNVARLKTT